MKAVLITQLVLVLVIFAAWATNFYKLTQCDWSAETSWKCEAVHAVGIIPPAAVVTSWFSFDE